jgi:hypothetical protein
MLGTISLMLVIALIGAGIMSTSVLNKQQVVAKSSDEIGQMLQNMSKLGVVITSTPVMCNSIGDIMVAISGGSCRGQFGKHDQYGEFIFKRA